MSELGLVGDCGKDMGMNEGRHIGLGKLRWFRQMREVAAEGSFLLDTIRPPEHLPEAV